MANNLKVFDTIQEYENATIPSNAVSYIKEDNSIRYSGGIETSMQAPITGIKVNGDVVNIDSDGKIDIGSIQETLVSGSNIKTINGFSVLGYGNIDISTNGTIDLSGYVTKEELSSVATSGDYNDLSNKPDNVVESTVSGWGFTKNPGTITSVSANGTTIASNGAANIPAATTSKYGVTKLSSSTNSTSTTLAATSSAVKSAYDLASSKQDVISDLDEIRNKANLGATAIQSVKTINGSSIVGTGDLVIESGDTLTEADILSMGFTKNAGTITGVSANGTSVATSGVANIPAASTSKYGVTKLSSATNSTSTTLAATPSAVKAAYDLANSKVSWLDQDMIYANGFEDESGELYITPSAYAMGYEGTILATQSYVDNAVANASGSYVPMSNTWYDSPSSVTIAPNSSVEISDLGLTSIAINLTEPTDNSVVNTYTIIICKFGIGNAFTFDKTIIWANDNAPVSDTTASDEFVEISIKRTFEGYYLGTWAKYSV